MQIQASHGRVAMGAIGLAVTCVLGCGGDDSNLTATDTQTGTAGDGDGDPTGDGDGDPTGDGDGDPTGDGDGDPTGDGDGDPTGDGDGDPTGDGDGDSTGDGDGDPGIACDYEVGPNGVLMFEAESLPILDDWVFASEVPGYFGDGYIYWSGPSLNNQPGQGMLEVTLGIAQPGRYRVQWHTQIGMGNDATEHNDLWLRFTDAADYYGKKNDNPETRRYPRPICEDLDFLAGIEALPEVSEATCAAGSTSEGWMKVYSSGATNWKWSTQTSDNDAHQIYVEFDAPGAYTMQLSARADWMLFDRVVLHREDVDDATAHAMDQPETPCG